MSSISNLFIGCSGWNYGDTPDKGGWLGVFYPDKHTRKLNYYSQFFDTVEMDSTFYKKFYLNMTKGLFIGLTKATITNSSSSSTDKFKFSLKIPEIITHEKRLDVNKVVIDDVKEFLDKISPLKDSKKLGAIIFQMPPSFTIKEFSKTEEFFNILTSTPELADNDYAVEFRNPTWNTEGSFEMLQHYNIASVLTDSPVKENLGFLSDENNIVSKKIAVIRMHGRNISRDHYWYDYLYSEDELKPWVNKVKRIKEQVESVYVYFNNHYSGKAIVNALQFKEMINDQQQLPEKEEKVLENAKKFLSNEF